MAIAYYMDEHIPKPISIGLRVRGVDVLTVQEDQRRGAGDHVLLDRATALGRVMFAFDSDMLQEAARRQHAGEKFSGLVFAYPNRISVGDCIRQLEVIAGAGEPQDLLNQVIYLPF